MEWRVQDKHRLINFLNHNAQNGRAIMSEQHIAFNPETVALSIPEGFFHAVVILRDFRFDERADKHEPRAVVTVTGRAWVTAEEGSPYEIPLDRAQYGLHLTAETQAAEDNPALKAYYESGDPADLHDAIDFMLDQLEEAEK
jgi:hypothetical protein